MKQTSIPFEADNLNLKETPRKGKVSNAFKLLMAICMISGMTLLSSCMATLHSSQYDGTPRHSRRSVTVVQPASHHDNGNHYGQYKHNKKNKHED